MFSYFYSCAKGGAVGRTPLYRDINYYNFMLFFDKNRFFKKKEREREKEGKNKEF